MTIVTLLKDCGIVITGQTDKWLTIEQWHKLQEICRQITEVTGLSVGLTEFNIGDNPDSLVIFNKKNTNKENNGVYTTYGGDARGHRQLNEIAEISVIGGSPVMFSPGLQKSLMALGDSMPDFYDMMPSSNANGRSVGADIEENPNEISAISPVDASGVADDLDNSGTDLDNSLLDKVTGSSNDDIAISSPSGSFHRSPSSSVNTSLINAAEVTDVSTSSMDITTLRDGKGETRRSSRGAMNDVSLNMSGTLGRSKRKIHELQPIDKIQNKRISMEISFSPTTRETRSRRVR